MPTTPSKNLEIFPNPHPDRDYIIEIETAEFTCLCPKTGQPDFANIRLEYVPDQSCIELKSLKLYYWSYREQGAFHEDVSNRILNDLILALSPRFIRLTAEFNVRGGLYTTVELSHTKRGWTAPPPPPDHLPRETQELPANDAEEPGAANTDNNGSRSRVRKRLAKTAKTSQQEQKPKKKTKQAAPPLPPEPIYIGIDIGTTGCRALAIDDQQNVLAQTAAPLPASMVNGEQVTQDAKQWWQACLKVLQQLVGQIDGKRVQAISVDGTSSSVLLCDAKGKPTIPAMMYNDSRAIDQLETIEQHASREAAVHHPGSSLAKLLWLQQKGLDQKAHHFVHQADWILGKLSGVWGHSDYNNCLKLGYDAGLAEWPDWIKDIGVNTDVLPTIHAPGDTLGTITADLAKRLGLPAETTIISGTTDGVAAFLASGANNTGHGVTSLGSTLVLKLLSDSPVFSPEHGVYSHRLGNNWLVGGASNSGGHVLQQYFTAEQMEQMTPMLDPKTPTGLHYYPLLKTGERFPVNDPKLEPRLEPLPADSVNFFQGLLEGMADIEAQGYQVLAELGGPPCTEIYTTGGGSRNAAWTQIRMDTLGLPIKPPRSDQAAFGAALVAAGLLQQVFD